MPVTSDGIGIFVIRQNFICVIKAYNINKTSKIT